jgi:hypothetical protein
MSFAQFVKDNYDEVRDLPNKERMAALSKMYKGGSAKATKPKSTKPKSTKSTKKVEGGVMTAGVLTGAGVDFKQGKTPVHLALDDLNLD